MKVISIKHVRSEGSVFFGSGFGSGFGSALLMGSLEEDGAARVLEARGAAEPFKFLLRTEKERD